MAIIYAKIVKILNNTQVVIDKGLENGIREGMEFIIYDDGEEVRDPNSGKIIDRLEIPKGKVIVTHVMPKLSLLETGEKLVKIPSALEQAINVLDVYAPRIERVKQTLNIEGPTSALMELLKQQKTVRIGDKVRTTGI